MIKIKGFMNRYVHQYICKERPVYTALAVNSIFLLFILIFCTTAFETNDDSAMASIAYGAATNRYSMHLIFINCFIGAI